MQDDAIGVNRYGSEVVNWEQRRGEVKKAFVSSWDEYARHAWGESSPASA